MLGKHHCLTLACFRGKGALWHRHLSLKVLLRFSLVFDLSMVSQILEKFVCSETLKKRTAGLISLRKLDKSLMKSHFSQRVKLIVLLWNARTLYILLVRYYWYRKGLIFIEKDNDSLHNSNDIQATSDFWFPNRWTEEQGRLHGHQA